MTSVSAANRSPTSATRRGRVGALKDFVLRRATLSPASGASRHRRPAALRGTGEAWSGLHCYAAAIDRRRTLLAALLTILVVGASATGVQLADEIHRSGRPVTLAVGEHVRLPRTYRGRDIFWWLEATGLLAERYDQIDDLTRARHLPSPQLTGSRDAVTTDLNALTALGIRIVGRLGRISDGVAQFSGALANTCTLADLKMNRFLNRADEWATGRSRR